MNSDLTAQSFRILHDRIGDETILKSIYELLDYLDDDSDKQRALDVITSIAKLLPARKIQFSPELGDSDRVKRFCVQEMLRKV